MKTKKRGSVEGFVPERNRTLRGSSRLKTLNFSFILVLLVLLTSIIIISPDVFGKDAVVNINLPTDEFNKGENFKFHVCRGYKKSSNSG